jgi:hypothetical protein
LELTANLHRAALGVALKSTHCRSSGKPSLFRSKDDMITGSQLEGPHLLPPPPQFGMNLAF